MAGGRSRCATEESSMTSAELVNETRVVRQEEPGPGGHLGPLAVLRQISPFEADAASDRQEWVGLEAARFHAAFGSELHTPALTDDRLILFSRPPQELD